MTEMVVLTVICSAGTPDEVQRTYRSLSSQDDRRWQLCLVRAAGADDAELGEHLPLDPRISWLEAADGGPAAVLTAGLAAALGRHVAVADVGDELASRLVSEVAACPASEWGYADEQQCHGPRRRPTVWEKPDHSPELLRSQPYAVRTAFLPREVLIGSGGVRSRAGTAAWYDAVLRVSEVLGAGRHVRSVLWSRHGRASDRFACGRAEDSRWVVRDHCERTSIAVDDVSTIVVQGHVVGQRIIRSLSRRRRVSVVIPTRGSTSEVMGRPRCHVVELLRSMWTEDRYPDLEVVVVHDSVTPDAVLEELVTIVGEDLRLVEFEGRFDFSRKCNVGALAATGDLVCFLNDDMEVLEAGWVDAMVGHLEDPEVGAVGARLLFADRSLQHVGHHYVQGDAGHPLFGWRSTTLALGAAAHVAGERAGVTAACLLMRRAQFLELGAFSELFPLNYNDVDLCLKVREHGMRIVYTPHAELFHFESQTRDARVLPSEKEQLRTRWRGRMEDDPYLRMSRPATLRIRFIQSAHQATAPKLAAGLDVAPPAGHPVDER